MATRYRELPQQGLQEAELAWGGACVQGSSQQAVVMRAFSRLRGGGHLGKHRTPCQ